LHAAAVDAPALQAGVSEAKRKNGHFMAVKEIKEGHFLAPQPRTPSLLGSER
jgi:hypothetical protein